MPGGTEQGVKVRDLNSKIRRLETVAWGAGVLTAVVCIAAGFVFSNVSDIDYRLARLEERFAEGSLQLEAQGERERIAFDQHVRDKLGNAESRIEGIVQAFEANASKRNEEVDARIRNVLKGIRMMQGGRFVHPTNSGGGQVVLTIRFDEPFPKAPHVVLTPRNQDANPRLPDAFAFTIRDLSPTGFRVNVYRIDQGHQYEGWEQKLQIEWLAWVD